MSKVLEWGYYSHLKGKIKCLKGESALIRKHPSKKGKVLAQFDRMSLVLEEKISPGNVLVKHLAFGWHEFDRKEFNFKRF